MLTVGRQGWHISQAMKQPGKLHIHRAAWWIAAVVAWGAWNAQTDCFPLNENQARPSWYVYGWPICYTTSGRGRFNFRRFDETALIVDVTLSFMMVACTVFSTELLLRHIPRLTIAHMLAVTAGFSATFFLWSGGLDSLWEWTLGAVPPHPEISATAGDVQPMKRLSPVVTFPLSLGMAGIGFATVAMPFIWFNRRSSPDCSEIPQL